MTEAPDDDESDVAGDHVYVFAPEADKETVFVAQTDASLTTTIGSALTITMTASEFVHPFASVPVTVYVVEPNVGANEVPFVIPPVHEYVDAPVAANVTFGP